MRRLVAGLGGAVTRSLELGYLPMYGYLMIAGDGQAKLSLSTYFVLPPLFCIEVPRNPVGDQSSQEVQVPLVANILKPGKGLIHLCDF